MERLLIIDAEGSTAKEFASYFEAWGYEVSSVKSAGEGSSLLEAAKYSAIFIDESVLESDAPSVINGLASVAGTALLLPVAKHGSRLVHELDGVSGIENIVEKPTDMTEVIFFLESNLHHSSSSGRSVSGRVVTKEEREAARDRRYAELLKKRLAGAVNGEE